MTSKICVCFVVIWFRVWKIALGEMCELAEHWTLGHFVDAADWRCYYLVPDLIWLLSLQYLFFCSLASYLFLNSLRHSFAPRQFFFPFLYNVNLRSLSDPHYIWEATCSQAVWRKISCSAIPHCASLYFDALVLYSFCSSGRFYRSLCILTLLFCSRILLYISLSLSISYWFVFVEFVRFYFHFLCLDFENLRKEITL